MKATEKLTLTIKETKVYEIEVSSENGYDAFPDTVLEMVDYINEMKNNIETYIDDHPPTEKEVELIDIKEN